MKDNKLFNVGMFIVGWIISILIMSCADDVGISATRIGQKPDKVKDLISKEIAGGAEISYTLPTTNDLRYVKALYTLENGREMVVKGSLYDNKLQVQGFAKEGEAEVTLTAVSVGEVESEPVSIKVKIGKPFYQILAETFKTEDFFFGTFGGINVRYLNTEAANLIFRVFKYDLDSVQNKMAWLNINETYTKSKEGIIRVRGEKPEEALYGIVVRDQWGNISDTVKRIITPLEEIQFKNLKLYKNIVTYTDQNRNGDYTKADFTGRDGAEMEVALFDGVEATPYFNTNKNWWGKAAPIPFQFTIDLGKQSQLSRVKIWGRNFDTHLLFQATHPKEFELYGSNNPASDGSWESWDYIGTVEGIRPSGLAFGVNATAEDQDYGKKGEDFEISWDLPGGYRYIRVKVNCTWNGIREQPLGNPLTVCFSEIQLFGKYIN
jgi:hypothetical protein